MYVGGGGEVRNISKNLGSLNIAEKGDKLYFQPDTGGRAREVYIKGL